MNNSQIEDVYNIAKDIYPNVIKMVDKSGLPEDMQEKLIEDFKNGTKTEEESADVVATYAARLAFQFGKALYNQFEYEKIENESAHNLRKEFLGRKLLELSDMVKNMTKVCEECKLTRGGVGTATRFIDEFYESVKSENEMLKGKIK